MTKTELQALLQERDAQILVLQNKLTQVQGELIDRKRAQNAVSARRVAIERGRELSRAGQTVRVVGESVSIRLQDGSYREV